MMVGSESGDCSEPRLAIGLCDMLRNLEMSFKLLKVFKRFWFCFYVYICAFKNWHCNKIFLNYL